jgi:preprotein translocase subunit SecD
MRMRGLASVLMAVALVAGCGVSRVTVGEGSPVIAARITLLPVAGVKPTKAETDEAVAVLTARLDALGVGNFSISAGDDITVELDEQADLAKVQPAVQTPGVIEFSPQPGDEALPQIGEQVSGQESLWTGDEVESASASTDSQGAATLTVHLTAAGKTALATWSAAHVGDYLVIVLDGRVVAVARVEAPIPGGTLDITSPTGFRIPPESLAAILASGPLPEGWRQP